MPALAIDIWTFRLDASEHAAAELTSLLSSEEAERARRYVRPQDSLHFRVGRGRMREILAGYLNVEPRSLAFAYGANGKPHLALPQSGLEFNLTHSDGLAALAVSRYAVVGIDIEHIRPLEDGELDSNFTPREQAVLARLSGSERLSTFYRCWTRKEAIIKAHGAGLEIPLDRFDVPIDGDEPVFVQGWDGGAVEGWHVASFLPAPGFAGAYAIASGPTAHTDVRWRQWPDEGR